MEQTNDATPLAAESGELFKKLLEPLLPRFVELDSFFEQDVAAYEKEVQPLVRYCFGHSGKKLRPLLVFMMAEGKGFYGDAITKAAGIVELVHLATLVHDDILDDAELRHRTKTVAAEYGSHTAVLLGDSLFARALELSATYPDNSVCRAVARSTRLVCSGEISQTFARGETNLSLERYFHMIDLKTAELFAVSAWLGVHLSQGAKEEAQAASDFARHLGIAYQIYDDAADIFSEESKAGKTLGTDLESGKFTLPVLLYLERISSSEREKLLKDLKTGAISPEYLSQQLKSEGIMDACHGYFLNHIESARKCISPINLSKGSQLLDYAANFVELNWNKLLG